MIISHYNNYAEQLGSCRLSCTNCVLSWVWVNFLAQVPREHKQNCFTVVDWHHERMLDKDRFPLHCTDFECITENHWKNQQFLQIYLLYEWPRDLGHYQVKQVVKVIWQNGGISSVVFARWGQCAPHLIHPTLGESTTQTASRSIQPFLLCTAHGRVSSGITGHIFSP